MKKILPESGISTPKNELNMPELSKKVAPEIFIENTRKTDKSKTL
jgi:hypothetical protein